MKVLLGLLLFCAAANLCRAADGVVRVVKPLEVVAELGTTPLPKELDGLQWNRWTSKNFVVCALNDTQAQYLYNHLESVKTWIFTRWGLPDTDFSVPCKVIGVDDPSLFTKLFRLDHTRVEVRVDDAGKIKETVIFLLINDAPSKTVPVPLTEVCFAEWGRRYGRPLPVWAERGMGLLNGTVGQIKERLAEVRVPLGRNDPLYFSKGLAEMTRESYGELDAAKRRLFDNCAMAFCLLVRKEFGQDAFLKLLRGADRPEAMIRECLRFDGYDQFDRTLKRYLTDLTSDAASGKTPDGYLQVREKSAR